MIQEYIEAGKIVGTHALKGEVRVEVWCDSAAFLCKFKRLFFKDGSEIKVLKARPHKNMAILLLENTDTVEKADLLRGKILYFKRAEARLPKGVYFIQDMLGLSVIDEDTSEEYGKITDVIKTGANDVYQIEKNGKEYLVPVIPEIIVEKAPEKGYVKISTKIIKGIFDEDD